VLSIFFELLTVFVYALGREGDFHVTRNGSKISLGLGGAVQRHRDSIDHCMCMIDGESALGMYRAASARHISKSGADDILTGETQDYTPDGNMVP
jgi:hypothetical protein